MHAHDPLARRPTGAYAPTGAVFLVKINGIIEINTEKNSENICL